MARELYWSGTRFGTGKGLGKLKEGILLSLMIK